MRDTNLIITVPADALAHRGSEQSHYNDVIMRATASQITSLTIVSSTVYSRRRSKKTSKLRVTGLCERNSSVTGEFPAQRASNAENVSIWWRHHEQVTVLTSKYTVMEMSFSRNFYHCSDSRNCRNDNKLFSLRWYMINFSPDHAIQMADEISGNLVARIETETKWTTFCRRHFQTHFLLWKNWNVTEVCS